MLMKQAILLLAVFLYQWSDAQQPAYPANTDLTKYPPVKYDGLKKFKPDNYFMLKSDNSQLYISSFIQPELQEYNFKPLKHYLSEDMHQYRVDKNRETWAEFTNGMLSSYQQKKWLENKNYTQQRWMAQKVKGKQY